MSLTFLRNIRLFNKKDHTPAHAHPNAWTPLAVVESRQARESTLTTRTDTPPTRTGVGPNSLPSRKSAGPHAPQRAWARRTRKAAPPENHPSPKEQSHRPQTLAHGEHRKEGFGKDKSFEQRGMGDWKEGNAINAPTHAYAHQTARTRRVSHGRGAYGKPSLSRKPSLSKRTITPPPYFRPQGTSKRGIR